MVFILTLQVLIGRCLSALGPVADLGWKLQEDAERLLAERRRRAGRR